MKLNFADGSFFKGAFSNNFLNLQVPFPIIILLFLGLSSCTREIATDKMPATQIAFGHGGGFTGLVHEYALLKNGYIVKIQKDSATQRIVKKIGKKKAATYFAAVDSMRLHTWLYNVPGNIYHYVILKQEGKKDNKIVWDGSGNDSHAPKNIEDFHMKLSAELPKKKEKHKESKY
jgi:uncharacterized protein YdbL (DUF1318 family)